MYLPTSSEKWHTQATYHQKFLLFLMAKFELIKYIPYSQRIERCSAEFVCRCIRLEVEAMKPNLKFW